MARAKQNKNTTSKKAAPAKKAPVKKAPPAKKAPAKKAPPKKEPVEEEPPKVEEPELTPVESTEEDHSESESESDSEEEHSESESEPEEQAIEAKPAAKGKAAAKKPAVKGKAAAKKPAVKGKGKAPAAKKPVAKPAAKGKAAAKPVAKGKATAKKSAAKGKAGSKKAGSRQDISAPVITNFVAKALTLLQDEGKVEKTETVKVKDKESEKVSEVTRDVKINISKTSHAPIRELFGTVIDRVAVEVARESGADAKKTVSPDHVFAVAQNKYSLSKDDLSSEDDFILAKAVVQRRIRSAIEKNMDKLRFSPDAFDAVQRLLEHIFVNISTLFLLSAVHGKRKTLQKSDIDLVAMTRGSKY
jgi:histone H3/H4